MLYIHDIMGTFDWGHTDDSVFIIVGRYTAESITAAQAETYSE